MKFSKKNKWKWISTAILGCLVIALAIFVALESWNQGKRPSRNVASQAGRQSRAPASIQKVFDFSHLQGRALEFAAKQRLLNSINIARENNEAVIEMGNFVMTNDNSQKDFACGVYDQVTLSFEAEGVAVNGEKPQLKVQTGCDVADNINALVPVRIPLRSLKAEKPSDTEYKFYGANRPMSIQVSNPPADWPNQWVLTEFKLTNSQSPSRVLHVQSNEIRENVGSIKMNW